jgi:hypothetical protein
MTTMLTATIMPGNHGLVRAAIVELEQAHGLTGRNGCELRDDAGAGVEDGG